MCLSCLIKRIFSHSGHPQVSPPACNFCLRVPLFSHLSLTYICHLPESIWRALGLSDPILLVSPLIPHPPPTSGCWFLLHSCGDVELRTPETFCTFGRKRPQSEVSLFGCCSRLLSRVQPEHLKEAPEENQQ